VLLLTVVEVGDDVPGHVDQKDTPHSVVDQFSLEDLLNPVELFLIKRV
jgi:hypothetical protein